MLCQYYVILYAGCAHIASFTASHILPNCGEGQGWTLKYEDRKCLKCEDHDFCHKNVGPVSSLDSQLEKEEENVRQLESSHLQFPKVNRVKLNNESGKCVFGLPPLNSPDAEDHLPVPQSFFVPTDAPRLFRAARSTICLKAQRQPYPHSNAHPLALSKHRLLATNPKHE